MKENGCAKPIQVLLVEDDPGDVDLTLEVMDQSKLKININVVEDGVKAMEFLNREGEFNNASKPDIILLDLNMPRKDGREVLEEIKSNDEFKAIPVVILTTSSAEEDIMKSYTEGASCYITKPVGLEQFSKVVRSLEDFWFTIVKLPPNY